MDSNKTRQNSGQAFTIVELLTVMSIIIVLIGLLVPAMNRVRRVARKVKQNAQFHAIAAGMEMFSNEFEGYPDSERLDEAGMPYCGAMKLAEAMVGQDMLGFHPDSRFTADGLDGNGNWLYPTDSALADPTLPAYKQNLKVREGPYLQIDGANAYHLNDIYRTQATFTDPNGGLVLCDEYSRVTHLRTGKRVGMPILYYKADISKIMHDPAAVNATDNSNIYNRFDNQDLVDLGLPWDPSLARAHRMATTGTTPEDYTADPDVFYDVTRDENVSAVWRPKNPDSYILMSAGYDGLYGTEDDVFNFKE